MAPSDATPTEPNGAAPADRAAPAERAVAPARLRRPIAAWLIPILASAAALVIGLLGGILIGQNTANGGPHAGFVQSGNFGEGHGGLRPGNGNGGLRPHPGFSARPGASAGGFVAGTIESVSGDSIVIKKKDGSTVTVKTTDSTKVTKTSDSSASDLKAGEAVTVRGQADSDGNIAADSVSEGARPFGIR